MTGVVFEGRRAVAVDIERRGGGHRADRGRRDHPRRRRDQHAAAPPAVGRRARPTTSARARDPGRGRPAGRRRAPPGPSRGLHPVQVAPAGLDAADRDRRLWRRPFIGAAVAVPAQRPGRDEPFRGRRVRPLERRRRLPEPDVPLPAAGDPLRRQRRRGRPRLPGPRRADVLRRARVRLAQDDRPARPSGAALQLPLDRPGPARVGRGDPGRPAHPQPAGDGSVQRRRDVAGAGRSRPTRRSATGSRATPRPRSTRRARRGWASTTSPCSIR